MSFTNAQVEMIPVDELQPNPLQPRGVITPESLVDLIDSIKEHGVLEPLIVAKTPAGYQIIAGERRWRASKYAGLTHVPAVIKETSPRGMLELAIIENVQRVDLNALDRARGFQRLMDEFGLTNADVAQRIGKSPAYIANSLRLLKLPDALKDGLLSGLITEGHARALAAIDDHTLMVEAYKIILRESGSVRRAEDLARRMKVMSGQEKKPTGPIEGPIIISEEVDRMVAELRQRLTDRRLEDKPTNVKILRSRRETKLVIVFKGGLEETEERLQKLYSSVSSVNL
ncbi:MAG: ParB/RepB/Spo0J family partition protein [Candidatus Blackburnbacteria bacterium]|nr:ParB/RepB/Spo0J family partition protein [Candidatus Blackburnbacteria bacterium]